MALDHIARKRGQTILAMRALTRVATEFPDDPNAQAAAMTLANLHRRAGNEALASQYEELAKNSVFGEDVACRRLASLEASAPGAADAARAYLAEYESGRCRETAEALLGDVEDEASEARDGEEPASDRPKNGETAPPAPSSSAAPPAPPPSTEAPR
jgi:hypothetical protein